MLAATIKLIKGLPFDGLSRSSHHQADPGCHQIRARRLIKQCTSWFLSFRAASFCCTFSTSRSSRLALKGVRGVHI